MNDTATAEIYTLSLPAALPIYQPSTARMLGNSTATCCTSRLPALRPAWRTNVSMYEAWARCTSSASPAAASRRSEEHTSELQSRQYLVCRLLLEKNKKRAQLPL